MDFYEVVNNNGHCTPTRRKIPLLRKKKHFDEKINSRCASVRVDLAETLERGCSECLSNK